MSFQQQVHHTVNEYVPTYQVKSDYLPTRVQDGNQNQTNVWVLFFLKLS